MIKSLAGWRQPASRRLSVCKSTRLQRGLRIPDSNPCSTRPGCGTSAGSSPPQALSARGADGFHGLSAEGPWGLNVMHRALCLWLCQGPQNKSGAALRAYRSLWQSHGLSEAGLTARWPKEWTTCSTSASKNEQNILWGPIMPTLPYDLVLGLPYLCCSPPCTPAPELGATF